MCGITGVYAFNEIGRLFCINTLKANNQMEHRGPDIGRVFSDYYVSLGHRRLSIIDLSHGATQPMSDESERYTLVFNGEIYNYKKLRQGLQSKGVSFRTESDTEVLLQMYIHHGKECVKHFNGFFAFAVFDKVENSLFIARDRFGIKPLLYFHDEDKLVFASEMNALLAYNIPKEIDWVSAFQYFQLSYIPDPDSIYKGVSKLESGHSLFIRDKQVIKEKFYDLDYQEPLVAPSSYDEACKQLLELIDQSVQERMVADVPLGAFLSGGIDSSTVVAFASRYTDKLNTFSIGYKDEPLFDETKYARLVAEKYKTNHTAFQLTEDDFYNHLFDILGHFGEPFADSSSIPVYILSQKTRQKVTVALSGDGGDEIFAGYNKYWGEYKAREKGALAQLLEMGLPVLDKLPKSRNSTIGNKVRQLHKFASGLRLSPQERYWYLCSWTAEEQVRSYFTEEVLSAVDSEKYNNRKQQLTAPITGEGINDILYADIKMLLPNDMLHKVDSMSMASSLEVRVPFLDHRIAEFAFKLPADYKINGKLKKRILQDAVRPLLPTEIYNRPKHGFEVPLMKGYKGALKGWVEDLLDKDFIREQGVFSPTQIENIKYLIFNSTNFDQNQVWAVLAFQHWWKKYMQ